MNIINMRSCFLASSALLSFYCVIAPSMAAAQAGDVAPPSTSASEPSQQGGDNGLGEIVVTAQRRAENLQRAAISVSAIGGDELTRRSVSSVTQLQTAVPALQVGVATGPNAQFTLRGVGNLVVNVNSDTAVVTNLDGVPIARPSSVTGLFYDLERIEVLKGPQGTLYGRNATGGAINVITKKPVLGETSGYINGSYGNYDAVNLAAAINLPVGESVALRVAGTLNQHDGYFSDGTGDERTRAVRGQLRANLTDTVTLTVAADYSHSGGVGAGGTVFSTDLRRRIGHFDPRSQAVYASTFSVPTFAFLNPPTERGFQDNSQWGVSANLEWESPIGTLSFTPSYRKTNLNYLSTISITTLTEEEDIQKTAELRLVSDNSGPLEYILGAFYMQEDNNAAVNYNQGFFSATGIYAPTSKAYAGYARLTYKVTPAFRVSLAGRYTTDKRTTYQDIVNALVVCPAAVPGDPTTYCIGTPSLPTSLTTPPEWSNGAGGYLPAVPIGTSGALVSITYGGIFRAEKTFNKFTWRAGLEYDVGPNSLLYATYETGFKAGGFYNAPVEDPTFGPETVKSWTVGSKNRFLDNRLQLNVEGFWLEYSDKQFTHIAAVPGGATAVTENIGKSRLRGVELDIVGKATDTTTLNLTVQYLDAKEVSFAYDALALFGPPTTGCSSIGPTGGNYEVDCSGKRSVNSPEWTINAGFEQVFPLSSGANIKVNAQTRYQSAVQTSYDFLAAGKQDGYFMSDAYLTYEAPDNKYYITAFISNIENTAAYTFTLGHPRSTDPILFGHSLTPPRTYGVRVGVNF